MLQLLLSVVCSRLRDKLIQDERLKLAMDVSTKCGLDPSGVWGAWGLTCIKQGDYAGAREKFGRCLKVCVWSKWRECVNDSALFIKKLDQLIYLKNLYKLKNIRCQGWFEIRALHQCSYVLFKFNIITLYYNCYIY